MRLPLRTPPGPMCGLAMCLAVGLLLPASRTLAAARTTPAVLPLTEARAGVARVAVRSYIFTEKDGEKAIFILNKKGPGPGEVKPISLKDLKKNPGVKLAEQFRPLRTVILAGSFPLRKQRAEFQKKLRLDKDADLDKENALRFLRVEVERQTLAGDGKKIVQDWQRMDFAATYRPWLEMTGRRFAPDDPRYRVVTFPGLVMGRPDVLATKGASYPDVASGLRDLNKAIAALPPIPPPDPGGFDPFNPKAPAKPPAKAPAPPVPDHCLVRVFDVTAKPGTTYRYRLRIVMANPNFGHRDVEKRADALAKELTSPWWELPRPVRVLLDLQVYVVDQAKLDGEPAPKVGRRQVAFQLHRWVETVYSKGGRPRLVADWLVAERVRVSRGEYVAGRIPVRFPVWSITCDTFALVPAKPPKGERPAGFPVNFGHGRPDEQETVLVDFEGGEKEECATEVLLLTPDGKLIARDCRRDARDKTRGLRVNSLRERVTSLRKLEDPGGVEFRRPADTLPAPLRPRPRLRTGFGSAPDYPAPFPPPR